MLLTYVGLVAFIMEAVINTFKNIYNSLNYVQITLDMENKTKVIMSAQASLDHNQIPGDGMKVRLLSSSNFIIM